ncbi:MAG TPA: sialate O-acetylesterase [Planctomycetota bacterium]|jgi:sialate O-acetylesterase|nr:sialate O-acetylesterase [Planctomycetota bacterium]OQC21408.1 MAG: Glycosyl hydrolases family 2, sugar binding domain [Planctomycetes bacterium ADurb.Bin069]HNR97831.1 sialate O-acetylesterase [Planctomycetota bacterium]HNU24702.1 sialate O-acetylesterase [Planctomycetota bacterium]HOE29904.1 sialate O-acetylesterase [Planctomycetota bacterium]
MRRPCFAIVLLAVAPAVAAAAEPGIVFEDRFEGMLGEGWQWLREDPAAWRISEGALEIRIEPGLAHTVKNALVRPAPDRTKGAYAIEVTVTSMTAPTNQFEQAGITWYSGGRPVFKFVKELIDGKLYVFPGKVPMDRRTVRLRLIVSPKGVVAQFRPEGEEEFRTAVESELPPPSGDQVSLQCYNGPPDADHRVRFDDFRIIDLEGGAAARPFVHPLFSDHMVIQRDAPVPVWGWTEPGREVAVTIAGVRATARAAADGKWLARLAPLAAGGPHVLEVTGPRRIVLADVLVGDVWICSGQSNMQWPVAASQAAEAEIAAADLPAIRLFTVPRRTAMEPEPLVAGAWTPCSPRSVPNFSAVGFFFGRELYKELGVPIGLIDSSWGGTVAEAWMSAEALAPMEDFARPVAEMKELAAAGKSGEDRFAQLMARWWRENDPGSKEEPRWENPAFDAAAWKTMRLPSKWEDAGLPNFDGLVWFRKEIELPAAWAGKEAILRLGPIDDRDTTWVNGARVGEGDDWTVPRTYKVPAGTLVAGRNVIAVRVLDTGGAGGLVGAPDQLALELAGGGAPAVPLAGPWSWREAVPLARLGAAPQKPGSNPNVVTVLYNGMIAPLAPFAIKGAIWYQGESNADRPAQYRRLLPALIRDWRARFETGDFPFLVVQLANFMAPQKEPVEAGWAELREAQLLTAQADPKVGLAVTIDIGAADDIHPRNKQDVGRRLALEALRIGGGGDIVSTGPEYAGMELRGGEIVLRFRGVGGGLVAGGGGKLKGFAIAGKDGKFAWADAAIAGDTVVVASPAVPEPVAVRYGWANNPDCNLYNKEGLPASPFRTDTEAR